MSLLREENVKLYAITTGQQNAPTGVSISMFKNFIPRMFYDILVQLMVHVLFGTGCTGGISTIATEFEIENPMKVINVYKNAVFDFLIKTLTALYGLNCHILSLLTKKKIAKYEFGSTLRSIRKMIREKRYGAKDVEVDSMPSSFTSYEDYLTSGLVLSTRDIEKNGEKIKEIIDRLKVIIEGPDYKLDGKVVINSELVEELFLDLFAKYGIYQSTGFFGALLEFATDISARSGSREDKIVVAVNNMLLRETVRRFEFKTEDTLAPATIGPISDVFLKRNFHVDCVITYFSEKTITLENLNKLLCFTSNCTLNIKAEKSKLTFQQLLQAAGKKSQPLQKRIHDRILEICKKLRIADEAIKPLLAEHIGLIDITMTRLHQYPSAIDAFCPQGGRSIKLIPFYGLMRASVVDNNMKMFVSQVFESGHITTTPSSPVSCITRSTSGKGSSELALAIRNGLNNYAEMLKEKAKTRDGTSTANVSRTEIEKCETIIWRRFHNNNVVADLEQLRFVIAEFKRRNPKVKGIEKIDPAKANAKAIADAIEVIRQSSFMQSGQIDSSYASFDPEHLNPFCGLPGSLVISDNDLKLKVSQDLLRFMEDNVKDPHMRTLLNAVKGCATERQVKCFGEETGML